jgi:hypothetical protein
LSLKQQAIQSEGQLIQDEIMQDVDQPELLPLPPVTHPGVPESQGKVDDDNQDAEKFILVQHKIHRSGKNYRRKLQLHKVLMFKLLECNMIRSRN